MGICTSILIEKIEALEKRVLELEKNQVVAESATSEEQDCLWVARDKRTDTLYVYEVEPIEQYCETFAADDEEEKSFRIDFDLFPEVTFENSPQKLVLESSISKAETVEEGYDPTIDDFFYNRDEENSEKPGNYPSHWPRKADGSGVQVGDCVEIRLNEDDFRVYNIVSVNYHDSTLEFYLYNFHDRPSRYSFNDTAWSVGYQFRFPEEQAKQEFDRERALELLQDIESSSTKNSNASTKAILLSCAELREMLVGE